MGNEFKTALDKARQELSQLEVEEKRNAERKAQLLHSIAGLSALCGEAAIGSMSLADAIRMIFKNALKVNAKSTLSPKQVRDALRSYGFDLDQFNNEMASIHTAINRMLTAGEIEPVGDVEYGAAYRWKEPEMNAGYFKRKLADLNKK